MIPILPTRMINIEIDFNPTGFLKNFQPLIQSTLVLQLAWLAIQECSFTVSKCPQFLPHLLYDV